MTRIEFETLRDLPGKTISSDIIYIKKPDYGGNLAFSQISVENDTGWDVLLNGTYKPEIPTITFNFVVRGIGPICRVCVNGSFHGTSGRTHKHSLRDPNDPRSNLPTALPRPDLDGKTVVEVWETLCLEANIKHTGKFISPE